MSAFICVLVEEKNLLSDQCVQGVTLEMLALISCADRITTGRLFYHQALQIEHR